MSETADLETSIAIIGMAGRFPGAADVEQLWEELAAGREGIRHFSIEELREAGVDEQLLASTSYVRAKGTIEDADCFDSEFFGIGPREANVMDPQHRVFLECSWSALESAGIDPARFDGRIGIFGGASLNTYLLENLVPERRSLEAMGRYQTQLASDKDYLATRVAYKLGLTGPAMTVQTACSTSLLAIHLACQSLLSGECDLALAGGVSVNVPLRNGYQHDPGGILSTDGHCRPFDADAGGTVIGNGVGIIVLRRAEEAVAERDHVRALVLGSAVNNDGALKVGYTAPSVDGQAEVVAEALAVAGAEPGTVGYIETHGTGTPLGDPIEIAALGRAYGSEPLKPGSIRIGSVKSNLGHLDAAAGVTGVIKAVLAMEHGQVPSTLHFRRSNPQLELDRTPFRVVAEKEQWPRTDGPRRAGVSAFGIGGTNVHLVLEEAPALSTSAISTDDQDESSQVMLTLSARSIASLDQASHRLADHIEAHPEQSLDEVARTLAGRRAFEHRRTVVACSRAEAAAALRRSFTARVASEPGVVLLFPGQGAQYPGMARALAEAEPVFGRELDQCLELFTPHLDQDLRQLLFPVEGSDPKQAAAALQMTVVAQPALFAVEYALARTLLSWGVRPAAMVGHSIGEYVAACMAGMLSLADAVAVVAARGRFMQQCQQGAMLSVLAPAEQVRPRLGEDLWVATVNSPTSCVVSGQELAVQALTEALETEGIGHRRLQTSHAFHSSAMEPAAAQLVDFLAGIEFSPPQLPVCSTLTGQWMDERDTNAQYWGDQLRQPVLFADALATVLQDPNTVLLEVGPGQALTSAAQTQLAPGQQWRAMATFPRKQGVGNEQQTILAALGSLWEAGAIVDREALARDTARPVVDLPTYAFQRTRHWVDPVTAPLSEVRASAVDGMIYQPVWQQLAPELERAAWPVEQTWLLLGAESPLAAALAVEHRSRGGRVVEVVAGEQFARLDEDRYRLNPRNRAAHEQLLAEVGAPDQQLRILHLWSLATPEDRSEFYKGRCATELLGGLLALCQAIQTAALPGVQVDVFTSCVFPVTGAETLQPTHAALVGPCLSAPAEMKGLGMRLVDLDEAAAAMPDQALLADLAVGAPAGNSEIDSRMTARRAGQWWGRGYQLLADAAAPENVLRLRDGGVYLLSGGFGGVGLAIAGVLTDRLERPVLALLGRSELPPEQEWNRWIAEHGPLDATSQRLQAVRELQDRGAEVVPLVADVTDRVAVAQAVAGLRKRFGAIHGIVHAAGLPASGAIATLDAKVPSLVMDVKIDGTRALLTACAEQTPDFVLLCSSRTAVVGGPGQCDYVAANCCLDALAQQASKDGLPVVAVAWDTWEGTGMALKGGAVVEGDHPLIAERRLRKDGQEIILSRISTARSWIVDEHRIAGHGLVPGTTYLEIVRAAIQPRLGGRPFVLKDVMYTTPIVVPDGVERELYTTLEEVEGGYRFRVSTREVDSWTTHAYGQVIVLESEQTLAPRSLEELLEACSARELLEGEAQLRQRLRLDTAARDGVLKFSVSGRWRALNRIHLGDQGLVAELALPDDLGDEVSVYQLHPALMDIIGGVSRLEAGEGYYLPFGYDSVTVHAPLTARMNAAIRVEERDAQRETIGCDADIRDLNGRLLAEVRGFLMKRIHAPEGMREQIDASVRAMRSGEDVVASGPPAGTDPARALALLMRILDAPRLPAALVTSAEDLTAVRERMRTTDVHELAAALDQAEPPGSSHPRPELDTPYLAPRNEVEEHVARIWSEALGISAVGVEDDFFALGGHSLAAVQIAATMRSELGVTLDMASFFETPTVAHTALLVSGGTGEAQPAMRIERYEADEIDVSALSDAEVEALLGELVDQEGLDAGDLLEER